MSAPPVDPLAILLDLVRVAAREGAQEALASRETMTPATSASLIDKRGLAHALGVSSATVDRLCRSRRIPFIVVGDVRRFDLFAVRATLAEHNDPEPKLPALHMPKQVPIVGVRLLSRRAR